MVDYRNCVKPIFLLESGLYKFHRKCGGLRLNNNHLQIFRNRKDEERPSKANTLSLVLVCIFLQIVPSNFAFSRPLSFDKFDTAIKSATVKYWGDFPDWLFYKAQLYQESRLDESAVSRVGAAGLAQFMPGTWLQIAAKLSMAGARPSQIRPAIDAGAFYMASLRGQWNRNGRFPLERHRLALASYNAGLGNILRAQTACRAAREWVGVAPCLKEVTGSHAAETLAYVALIERWRGQLDGTR